MPQQALFSDGALSPVGAHAVAGNAVFGDCKVLRPEDLSNVAPAPHPAKFSEGIIETMAQVLGDHHGCVLDPFAGTGRIFELEQLGPWCVHATEYEPEWAVHHLRTWLCDARGLRFDDERFAVIATSPTYGNGMGQRHFHPNDAGKSKRYSYPDRLGRDMTPGNTGAVRWGEEYRQLHLAAWREAVRVLASGGRFLLNFRDSLKRKQLQPISGWHLETLRSLGLQLVGVAAVGTPGMRAGANNNPLGTGEAIFVLDKP